MSDSALDAVDRGILYLLQRDARKPITDIAARVGVSDNTVRNRIERMEEAGIIQGYSVDIDYARGDVRFHYQFDCTVRVSDREQLAGRALGVRGVVRTRTVMSGTRNVVITAVAEDEDDVTRIAIALDEMGLHIDQESLIRSESRELLERFEQSP